MLGSHDIPLTWMNFPSCPIKQQRLTRPDVGFTLIFAHGFSFERAFFWGGNRPGTYPTLTQQEPLQPPQLGDQRKGSPRGFTKSAKKNGAFPALVQWKMDVAPMESLNHDYGRDRGQQWKHSVVAGVYLVGGGFKYLLMFISKICRNDPIWFKFFRWVETTNYIYVYVYIYIRAYMNVYTFNLKYLVCLSLLH